MKKNVSIAFFILCFSLIFVSCESSVDREQKDIYNNSNQIINSRDSFNVFKEKTNAEKTKKGNYHSYGNEIKFEYGTFYGLETLKTISTKSDSEIDLKFTCKVGSGEFKAVFIDAEKNMQILFEGNCDSNKRIKLKKGDNKIRIVGNDAKDVEVSLEISEN